MSEKKRKNRKNRKKYIYIFFFNQARSIGNRLKKRWKQNRVIICSQKKVVFAGSWVVRFRKKERKKTKKSKKIEKK